MRALTTRLLPLLLLAAPALAQAGNVRTQPWPEEVLSVAERLSIQDGGRIKPLHTFAGFTLLRMHGSRSITTPFGERLTPIEWLLDTLFFPAASSDYPLFVVQNAEVVEAIGISQEGKKRRDRYSFNELRGGVQRLFQLANEYGELEERERSTVQQQLYLLAGNVDTYMRLLAHMDYARNTIPLGDSERVAGLFGGRTEVDLIDVLAESAALRELYDELAPTHGGESSGDPEDFHALSRLLTVAADLTSGTESMALIPPVEDVETAEAWLAVSDLFRVAFLTGEVDERQLAVAGSLARVARERSDSGTVREAVANLHEAQASLADARGERSKVDLEVTYYKARLLDYSQYLFVLAFLLLAFMWLRPRSRWLYWSVNSITLVATVLVSVAIVLRCVIRGRPPVSTLYETVLFVTATGAMIALFVEVVGRKRIAVSSAAVLGAVGMFIANGYEMLDKRDTMPSLIAVLDTNFWLATHVTSITIGYSAGMLAALIGSGYILGKLFGWRRADRGFYKSMARMVYGVLCFGLIFSIVGTILGGIWANDSWGRFWGWDPKENGALLIVVSQIAILHARLGGLLREHGMCMAAAFSGTIIGFSWWGVNLLGVGLHSYGFTSGIHTALWTYYGIQWGIVALGGIVWLRERAAASRTLDAGATLTREPERLVPGESTT